MSTMWRRIHSNKCTSAVLFKKCHHRWQYTSPECNVEMVCQYCGKHSWVTNTSNPNVAPMNVRINCKELSDVITKSESYCEVYDLTIEGEHEYFANGVLVHNCIDAARYYVLGELLGRILKPRDYSGIFGH